MALCCIKLTGRSNQDRCCADKCSFRKHNGERTSNFPHAHMHVHTQQDASIHICACVCTHKLVVKCVLSLVGFCSGLSIWSRRDDMCAGSDREWSGFQCFKMSNSPREHRHDIVVGGKSHGTKDGEGDWGL